MLHHNYFVYILTNSRRSVLYVGMTNDLAIRIEQHKENRNTLKGFTGRYACYHLVYYERHQYVNNAIDREKEIKKWRREKKEALIFNFNPSWKFLNQSIGED